MFCLGHFQRAGRPAAFWWRPAFFKKLKWRPVFFWWRPMTPCYNFYFAPNVTVRGNRRGNYACVSLFYSTAFVIVIRLVYKNLCYWPIRIYFGMLATDCCMTFIQWKQELKSSFHVFEMYAISILVLSRFSKTGFMLGFVYVIVTLHYVWHWFRLGEL